MVKETNLAYDLSRYEYQTEKEKSVIKAKKVVQKSASAPKTIAAILAAGLLMCSVLYSKVENSRLQNEISSQTKKVDLLHSENVRMQSEIEGKTSLKNIEVYAEKVLGLQKLDKSQIDYVQLQTDNVVEISDSNTNFFVKVKNKFNDILEYLRG